MIVIECSFEINYLLFKEIFVITGNFCDVNNFSSFSSWRISSLIGRGLGLSHSALCRAVYLEQIHSFEKFFEVKAGTMKCIYFWIRFFKVSLSPWWFNPYSLALLRRLVELSNLNTSFGKGARLLTGGQFFLHKWKNCH